MANPFEMAALCLSGAVEGVAAIVIVWSTARAMRAAVQFALQNPAAI